MNAAELHVLAVDDSLTIRKLLETVLRRAGYSFELASTGEEGIRLARRRRPDLVLLDYVLPDMKGLDVATTLSQSPDTKDVPIVLMSAKSDDLRPLFRSLPAVVDFVGKPFTAPDIAFLVSNRLDKRIGGTPAPGPPPSSSSFSHAQKETAARALFGHLRDRFAQIPDWLRGMGDSTPAPYFARKILTPDLMADLLEALRPTFVEVLGPASGDRAVDSDAPLRGETSVLPLGSLLKELGACGRTGVLSLETPQRRTLLYLRRGEIIFATHNQPDEYLRQAAFDRSALSRADQDRAEGAQRETGKPVFVSYAEAGMLGGADLTTLLYQQGKAALLDALDAGPCPFTWYEHKSLPAYVDASGRPFSLPQLSLERLRRVDDWAQVELHVNSLDLVFRRREQFSQNLRHFELTENERRVLTLVDGRSSVRQIIDRSGLATFEVFHVLYRTSQVGLVQKGEPGGVPFAGREGPVLILEPDVDGVQVPLAHMLKRRRQPLSLVAAEGSDVVASVLRQLPRLVLINPATPGLDAAAAVRAIRSQVEISDVPLVAVVDVEEGHKAESWIAAGFDAYVVKPFPFAELERFLVA